jgi:hypothetical protein
MVTKETKESFSSFLQELYRRSPDEKLRIVNGRLQGADGDEHPCLVM